MAKSDEIHEKVEELKGEVKDTEKKELKAQAEEKREEARDLDKKARE